MSVISAIQTYIKTYSQLETNAPVWVDYIGKEPTQYAISPLPGSRIAETFVNGVTMREYPFAFEMAGITADDAERLDNLNFFESFADWLETQNKNGTFPTLASGKTSRQIEALGWGYLLDDGESGTGVYQIQCKLTYEQDAV